MIDTKAMRRRKDSIRAEGKLVSKCISRSKLERPCNYEGLSVARTAMDSWRVLIGKGFGSYKRVDWEKRLDIQDEPGVLQP
jgi:hypothetical protein